MAAQQPLRHRVAILGAGGHGRVVADVVAAAGHTLAGFLDAHAPVGTEVAGCGGARVLGTEDALPGLLSDGTVTAVAVAIGDNDARAAAVARLRALAPAVAFPALVHPAATVARSATVGEGAVLCAGAIVGAASTVGPFALLNTGASLDHDSALGECASLAPRAATGGRVTVGPRAAVCLGAVVAHCVSVGAGSVLGAGATLLADLPPGVVAFGSPARIVRTRAPGEAYLGPPKRPQALPLQHQSATVAVDAAATKLACVTDGSASSTPTSAVSTTASVSPAAAPAAAAAAAAAAASAPAAPTPTAFTKRSVDQLTLFAPSTSPPTFAEFRHVGRPNIGDRAVFDAHVDAIFATGVLTNGGPLVRRLEAELAAFLGVKHFVAMCNGTVALEAAVRALGLPPGCEVIVPSYTFIASAHCLANTGVTPVFADVDPATHTLDPAAVAAAITPRTRAILGVHLWGTPCDTDALAALAAKHGLALFYDAAHAFGCARNGVRVGGFGACEVFSFHATKFFNCMEGGGVATNDDALATSLRLGINFGIKTYDQCVSLGTNGKMTEVCAAMGLTNLPRVRAVVETNRRHHAAYAAALNALPGLRVYDFHAAAAAQAAARGGAAVPPPSLEVNYQYVVVEVDAAAAGLSRDQLVGLLVGENFSARRYFAPGCHGAAPYAAAPDAAAVAARLPVTAHLCDSVMCLPTGTSVTADDVPAAAALLRFALTHAAEVRARCATLPYPLPLGPGQLPAPTTQPQQQK